MVTILADLSPQAIGLIFDLVDSKSLFRALIVGSTALANKVRLNVRHFSHVISHRTRFAKWPNFSYFPALEHVLVSTEDPTGEYDAACIYEVDLLALPSTLRTLELLFYNGLLCLIDLPPMAYSGGAFTPRLRQDIKEHFKSLESVTWLQESVLKDWDMRQFGEDLVCWPLASVSWQILPGVPLSRVSQLPSTCLSLLVELPPTPRLPEHASLPSSLLHLKLYKETSGTVLTYPHRSFGNSTISLADLPPLAGLHHLTSLDFRTEKIDTQLVQIIPRTLKRLSLKSQSAEIESFAYFPSDLTVLDVQFTWLVSAHPPKNEEELEAPFEPEMSTTMVEKLPTKLERLPEDIWRLIKPEDWSAFPSKNAVPRSKFNVNLTNRHIPYIYYLPSGIRRVTISISCTLELATVLPRHVTQLTLILEDPLEFPNPDELHLQSLFDTISQRLWRLEKLELLVTMGSDLSVLCYLNVPCLRDLKITGNYAYDSRWLELVPEPRTKPFNFPRLRSLRFDANGFLIAKYALAQILEACPELETFFVKEEDTDGPLYFPSSMVSLLPSTLKEFTSPIDIVDAATLRSFPRTLTSLEISRSSRISSKLEIQDVLLLPRTLTHLSIPDKQAKKTPKKDTLAILDELAKFFESDPQISFGSIERPALGHSLLALLTTERYSRSISKSAALPAPSQRMKRKHGE